MDGAENRKRSLVIAVDESEDARRACRWARQELYRPGDEVHILHVVPRLQHATMYGAPPIDFLPTQDAAAYENLIHNSEAYIARHFVSEFEGLQVEPVVHIIRSEVDTDSIGHVICKRADELNAVAVVMAKHSKGKLKEFFMGSVTNYCTHHSHRPVIVVH